MRPLVELTPEGLYCSSGGFHIDPRKGVDCAVITHAHSDHARRGSREYLCEESGVGLLQARLGNSIRVRGIPYRESFELGSVQVSLHSAGHILGSSQVRIQQGSEVWVVSGDYKREPDPSCTPFEVVPCDTFITEATFGTPAYQWPKQQNHGERIHRWWMENAAMGRNSVLFGYSLGKTQRILAELQPLASRPILLHESAEALTECYRKQGRSLSSTRPLQEALAQSERLAGELILAPPSVLRESWAEKLRPFVTAFASGWMQSGFRGRPLDHGFVLSDHADWNDLNQTIQDCGATRVFVQHRNGALVKHLRAQGIDAHPEEALRADQYARLPQRTPSLFGDLGQ